MWMLMLSALASAPMDSVVLVTQGSSTCAGALVDDRGSVLTAYHCVVTGGHPRILTRDGRFTIGRVQRVDRARDLAIVAAPGLSGDPHLTIATDPPIQGSAVAILGHPFGSSLPGGFFTGTLRWALSTGIVSVVGSEAVQTTAPINPGNSGGPVLNEDEEVVGVVSRRLGGDGLGFTGRTDDRATWMAGPHKSMGPLGGKVSTELMLQLNGFGTLGVGGRLEIALRDRVVLSGHAAFPVGIRWEALTLGTATHEPFEGRIAVRQRFFRGPWSTRVDAFAAIASLETFTSTGAGTDLRLRVSPALLLGGRIAVRNVAMEVGVEPLGTGFYKVAFLYRWPGTLFVL